MLKQNKRAAGILFTIIVLLSVPLIAMQFTTEVNWNISDFVVMGVLLLSTGFLCELVLRKVKSIKTGTIICVVVVIAFLLTWAELAVGIFGTPFAGH